MIHIWSNPKCTTTKVPDLKSGVTDMAKSRIALKDIPTRQTVTEFTEYLSRAPRSAAIY